MPGTRVFETTPSTPPVSRCRLLGRQHFQRSLRHGAMNRRRRVDSVPEQVLVWRRADRVPDYTRHGATVRCVSEARAVWRSQDLIEQRIRIE